MQEVNGGQLKKCQFTLSRNQSNSGRDGLHSFLDLPNFKQDSEPVEKVFLGNSWGFKIVKIR
jgi:hypothetical protein